MQKFPPLPAVSSDITPEQLVEQVCSKFEGDYNGVALVNCGSNSTLAFDAFDLIPPYLEAEVLENETQLQFYLQTWRKNNVLDFAQYSTCVAIPPTLPKLPFVFNKESSLSTPQTQPTELTRRQQKILDGIVNRFSESLRDEKCERDARSFSIYPVPKAQACERMSYTTFLTYQMLDVQPLVDALQQRLLRFVKAERICRRDRMGRPQLEWDVTIHPVSPQKAQKFGYVD
ncbi:MAG: hypothetical protein WAZ18_04240 [Alphaproteobacteria bacterium]